MKELRFIMGMPVIIEIIDPTASQEILDEVFAYFVYIDEKFSPYKTTSELSAINRGELKPDEFSADMKLVFTLAEKTKQQSRGFFDIKYNGRYDTSGLVKGWAILEAAKILKANGLNNFYVNVAGDIQVSGHNAAGGAWVIGIQNPFNKLEEFIKVVLLPAGGIATSGTYVRGSHIYNPTSEKTSLAEIISLTVIGPDVYEADRFATAAFAMGRPGLNFIESLSGFEAYLVDQQGIATMTSGFEKYCLKN
jgi:thiamine biosynthesis lipoprotein